MTPAAPLPRRIRPVTLSAFWFGTAFHWLLLLLILMPSNVVHFVGEEQKGLYLGILTALGALFALVIPPLVGAHSDRTGKRLPYLKLGVGVNVVGLLIMGLAVTFLGGSGGFWVYLLGLILVQFGNNYATAPYSALIPQLVPPHERGHYSGVMALLQAVGQLLGAVTGVAVGLLKLPAVVTFGLIALVLVIPAVLTMRSIPEDQAAPQPNAKAALNWASLRQLFSHQPFFWVFMTRVLFALGQYSVQPFLQYYAADVLRQPNPEQASSLLALAIIAASIASALYGGKLSDRLGRKPVIYVAGALMGVSALVLVLLHSFPLALAVALIFGLGFGAFTSVDWALGSDAMPNAENYARDMGIWHVAFVAPQFVGLPLGVVRDWGQQWGPQVGFPQLGYLLVFGLAALFFLAGVLLVRRVPETAHTN